MTTPSQALDDVRVPGLPDGIADGFLITGRPRIRSAWLASVLSACAPDDYPIFHEAPTAKHPVTAASFGLVDAGAATLWPKRALQLFADKTIIVISRDEDDSRTALERLMGQELPNWAELEKRYRYFLHAARPIVVPFEDLSNYSTVKSLVARLTGGLLTKQKFELFDGLRIEQDFIKAQKREQT